MQVLIRFSFAVHLLLCSYCINMSVAAALQSLHVHGRDSRRERIQTYRDSIPHGDIIASPTRSHLYYTTSNGQDVLAAVRERDNYRRFLPTDVSNSNNNGESETPWNSWNENEDHKWVHTHTVSYDYGESSKTADPNAVTLFQSPKTYHSVSFYEPEEDHQIPTPPAKTVVKHYVLSKGPSQTSIPVPLYGLPTQYSYPQQPHGNYEPYGVSTAPAPCTVYGSPSGKWHCPNYEVYGTPPPPVYGVPSTTESTTTTTATTTTSTTTPTTTTTTTTPTTTTTTTPTTTTTTPTTTTTTPTTTTTTPTTTTTTPTTTTTTPTTTTTTTPTTTTTTTTTTPTTTTTTTTTTTPRTTTTTTPTTTTTTTTITTTRRTTTTRPTTTTTTTRRPTTTSTTTTTTTTPTTTTTTTTPMTTTRPLYTAPPFMGYGASITLSTPVIYFTTTGMPMGYNDLPSLYEMPPTAAYSMIQGYEIKPTNSYYSPSAPRPYYGAPMTTPPSYNSPPTTAASVWNYGPPTTSPSTSTSWPMSTVATGYSIASTSPPTAAALYGPPGTTTRSPATVSTTKSSWPAEPSGYVQVPAQTTSTMSTLTTTSGRPQYGVPGSTPGQPLSEYNPVSSTVAPYGVPGQRPRQPIGHYESGSDGHIFGNLFNHGNAQNQNSQLGSGVSHHFLPPGLSNDGNNENENDESEESSSIWNLFGLL